MRDSLSAAYRIAPVLAIAALAMVMVVSLLHRSGMFGETVVVASQDPGATEAREFEMVTLLPKDGIPAIFSPTFVSADEADERFFDGDDLVMGVEINGDARAYGIAHLSSHEIVNDVVGGKPIAVTW